jgi:hypothetical protein
MKRWLSENRQAGRRQEKALKVTRSDFDDIGAWTALLNPMRGGDSLKKRKGPVGISSAWRNGARRAHWRCVVRKNGKRKTRA